MADYIVGLSSYMTRPSLYRTYASQNPLPGHSQTYYNQLAHLSNKLTTLWSQGGMPKDSLAYEQYNFSNGIWKITWITNKNAYMGLLEHTLG